MYCLPRRFVTRTLIPSALRDRLGGLLGGPAPGPRPQERTACLFALGHIGDFVLTLSALRLLAREFDPTRCLVVGTKPLAGLVARELPGVDFISLPMDGPSMLRDILPAWRRERRTLAAYRCARRISFSHQRSLYHELALSWIEAREDFRLLPQTYPLTPEPDTCTELLAHQRLAAQVLGRPVAREEILPAFVSESPSDDGRLLIYPLASTPDRFLPLPHTLASAQQWSATHDGPIVLGGASAERPSLEAYARALHNAGMTRVLVETPAGVEALVRHIANASALLAGDSAAAHIGVAFDKPVTLILPESQLGYCQPWRRSARQHCFTFDSAPEAVARTLA